MRPGARMGENSSEETSGSGTRGGMDRVTHESFCRAVVEDNTALLLSAVGSFRKEALCRIRKGSDASRVLDQEMSTRLLHLACKHNAVECARLLLEGGSGITAAPVDARDQLTRTPLHVAAETHSARCIQLLLSKNARTDLRVLDGRSLLPLEIALMSRRVQANWSLDNPIEDLLSFLRERDLSAVRLLGEKTRVVGELAYRYAMEGRVPAFAMLLLVVEEKISAQVSVVIDGVRTKRSIYNSIVDEALSLGDASARDGHERRKALLCEIQLVNQFGSASWREHNDKRTLPPLLRAAKVGDMNVIKMLLMGNVDVNEADSEGNTALHWCLSGGPRTQEPRIVWLLLKNGARVFQGNKLGLTPVHSAAAKGNYKALQSLLLHAQDCVDIPTKTKETPLFFAVKNGSVDCVKLLLRFGADTKARNLRKQRPIDVATSQDMRFALSSANVVPFSGNHSSPQKNRVMKKEIYKELLGDEFDEFDNDEYNESYTGLKTSVGQRDLRSTNRSAQGPKSKSQYVQKQGQGSKFVPRNNHWPKHDYTRKIFVGGLPPSVDSEYLIEFFNAEFGPVEEAVVIGIPVGNRVQSRGFGFVKFEREEDMMSAKEAHHVYMQGKRVEIKDAVARAYLPLEERGASLRKFVKESPQVADSVMDGELTEEHNLQKRRPLPEKCLPSWFFIFRRWLPGFLEDATARLGGERYPLSSLKGDFRATCRMELDHTALGYPKLSDFMRSLPGICRMCVVPVGSGPATHMVLLPPLSRPKYVPLLEPYSFDHNEQPESVSDHHSPRSPLNANITDDSPHNTDSQQGDDACSESNVRIQHVDDECSESDGKIQQCYESSMSSAESQHDGSSSSHGSLLDDIPVSTTKPDLIESAPTGKPDLIESVPTRKPDLIELPHPRKPGMFECVPTRPNMIDSRFLPQKNETGYIRKPNLLEFGPTKKLELSESRPTGSFIDRPSGMPAVTPSNCETEMRFSFFQSQWDKYLTPYPKSDSCIICRSCDAGMQLVPCLHKICVACMMRCNVRACMVCGTTVSGVKSSPAVDATYRYMGLMDRALDQRCQLMVVCRGAQAIIRCYPCMHTIACRGCFLASVTVLKSCTTCGCLVEHFKLG
ncbi:hypothetical protein U9M48_037146 [Paspalum notatum var. saurae]|uniref:Uncharacterized protein n=1 Tax=Paspalum notatum var. saurae TaxID=547442 RepID=A0AAQ3UIN9_PASNO